MSKKNRSFFKNNFDYEEDVYDRMKNINKKKNKYRCFTNKVTLKRYEFDYEEDPYEPEKSK